jgi:hypothetical protein
VLLLRFDTSLFLLAVSLSSELISHSVHLLFLKAVITICGGGDLQAATRTPSILFYSCNVLFVIFLRKIRKSTDIDWVRGGAVGWGTVLQVGTSRLRFQIMSCFIDIILLAALWLWGWHRLQHISWGQRRAVCRADNFTTFMCRLSWNLGASTSRNPQGLSRPVMGLLYLFTYIDRLWTGRSRNRGLISRRNEDYLLSAVPVNLWCRVGFLFNGCRGVFHGVKRPFREAHH